MAKANLTSASTFSGGSVKGEKTVATPKKAAQLRTEAYATSPSTGPFNPRTADTRRKKTVNTVDSLANRMSSVVSDTTPY